MLSQESSLYCFLYFCFYFDSYLLISSIGHCTLAQPGVKQGSYKHLLTDSLYARGGFVKWIHLEV